MPLFDAEAEAKRKAGLKNLEDKRVRFAEKLEAEGFRPDHMMFCSTEDGSFTAVARWKDGIAIIVSPRLTDDFDFHIEYQSKPDFTREDIYEKGTGLNGMLGIGRKAANGYVYHLRLQSGEETQMQVVMGRTSYLECDYRHNVLLKTKRRRGDANVIWEMRPFERGTVQKVADRLDQYYLV